jgi:hypothetical protein
MEHWTARPGLVQTRYRWFKFSLGLGALLAILLLFNSVVDYVFISHRIVIDQLRHEMSKQMGALDRQLRHAPGPDNSRLALLVEELRKDHKIAWIDVRDRQGKRLAHSGPDVSPSFTAEQIHAGFANHEPITRVRKTEAGAMVVEAFRTPLGLIEMAMSVDSANTVFWPLRRNLIIDCSAALALLVALVVIGVRFNSYVQGKQLEQQLAMARQVQQDLLPSPNQHVPGVRLAAECVPALGVGGDFYDVFPVNGGVAAVLGDVSGKGLPAALLMGVLHGAVRSASWAGSARQHAESTEKLNQLLCERTSGSRFASMFWSYYDAEAQRLHYINAGHCPPLLVRTSEGSLEVRQLDEGGPVLGLLADARYRQVEQSLEPGDLLILYSDGIVEAANADGEEFGDERLREAVEQCPSLTPDCIRDEIVQAVRSFIGRVPPHDDLTILAVQFEGVGVVREKRAAFTPEVLALV